jgi:hypothetical protein
MNASRKRHANVGRIATPMGLAGMIGGIAAGAARADDRRDWREHERHDRDRGDHDRGDRDRGERDRGGRDWHDRDWGDRRPVYVSPPPVVYARPPFGLDLVFPIHIR